MAEADIPIPSPSVFLATTPPNPAAASTSAPTAPSDPPPNAQAKTKAARKATGAAAPSTAAVGAGAGLGAGTGLSGGGADGPSSGVVKPKQSKSRNGCSTCKAKRLKCGEEKPGCLQCAKRNVLCGGYKKDFKWRPFGEVDVRQQVEQKKKAHSPKQRSADSSKAASPDVGMFASRAANTGVPPVGDEATHKRDSVLSSNSPHQERIVSPRPVKAKRMQAPRSNTAPIMTIAELQEPVLTSVMGDERPDTRGSNTDTLLLSPSHLDSGPVPMLSPTLTELLGPFDPNSPTHQAMLGFSLPEGFRGMLSPMIDPEMDLLDVGDLAGVEVDDDVERLQLALRSRRNSMPDLGSVGSGPSNYIYPQPFIDEGDPQMLAFRFDRITCGVLSIMDGPHENPWRNLIWPLTQQSPGLYHAIMAMTAFHAGGDLPQLRIIGHEHKAQSIRFIQEGIRDNSMGDQTAIATALALGFAESWDQHTATGNTHIKGAQALVRRALERYRLQPVEGDDLARLKFLCNAWVYMDVIARLTSVDSDESVDFDRTFIFSGEPNTCPSMVMGDTDTGFGIDFGMPIDARLDPLMGCANTLFPLIGRVANLVRKVCRSQTNSPAIISLANDLKLALEGWDPPAFIERPEDPSTDVQHTLQTAEAYRWATLLHLHASVPELPSLSSSELAQRVLQYLATVPLASRTVVVHIYPLMVAGCEAAASEDRQWIRARWRAMAERMRIGVIEKCHTVAEEVWRRRDNYEAQPRSNRKLVPTAELAPVRGREQPFQRAPTGQMRLGGDPGRTGVVFTYVENEGDAKSSNTSPNETDKPSLEETVKNMRARERRNGRDPRMGTLDPAYTVRGHLHWVGVMWDWGWESRLSQ